MYGALFIASSCEFKLFCSMPADLLKGCFAGSLLGENKFNTSEVMYVNLLCVDHSLR